jgi:hypothetical protein
LLIVAYAQFVILLIELWKVRFQELHCLCRESTTVSSEFAEPKTIDVSLLHIYCIRNKSIYCTEMYVYCIYVKYILYRSVCPLVLWSYSIYDEVVGPLTHRKYTVLNGNFVFDLYDFDLCSVFQECIPGV